MKRKKKCPQKKEEKYVVRYFTPTWEECCELRTRGTLADALINVAIWCRSRSLDQSDETILVFSVYHNYPYITIEEEGYDDGQATQEA